MEGLVHLGYHVRTVCQRGLRLLKALRKQRQLLPVAQREKENRHEWMNRLNLRLLIVMHIKQQLPLILFPPSLPPCLPVFPGHGRPKGEVVHHVRHVRHGGVQIVVFTPRLDVEVPRHAVDEQEAREEAAGVLGLGEKGPFDFFSVLGGGGGDLGVQVECALNVGGEGLHRPTGRGEERRGRTMRQRGRERGREGGREERT